jgi:hypothetical protein
VPAGTASLTADLALASDAADPVGAYLISPDGDTLGYGQNTVAAGQDPVTGAITFAPGTALTAYTLHPVPGTWTLAVDFAEPVTGNEVAQPFTGRVAANAVRATAAGLPATAAVTLPAGHAVTIPVTITPAGPAGTVVRGDLYADVFDGSVPPSGQLGGDERAASPYAYTTG